MDVKHAKLLLMRSLIKTLEDKWKNAGFEVLKLGEIARPSTEKIKTKPNETYMFASVHFDGTISLRSEKLKKKYAERKMTTKYRELYVLKSGDVVASGIDFINGAVAIVPKELENTVVSKEFIVLKPYRVSPYYLWLLLRTEYVRSIAAGIMTGMTGRHRVRWKQLAEVKVPVPKSQIITDLETKINKAIQYQKEAKKLMEAAMQIVNNIVLPP
jgi:restriction endonuclease S subunit